MQGKTLHALGVGVHIALVSLHGTGAAYNHVRKNRWAVWFHLGAGAVSVCCAITHARAARPRRQHEMETGPVDDVYCGV